MSLKTRISQRRILDLEQGAEPSLTELRALAEFFQVDTADLLPTKARHHEFNLLFRTGAKPLDEITSSALCRRIGYSVDLVSPSEEPIAWRGLFSRSGQSYDDAERNAEIFRNEFFEGDHLGPLYALPEIATQRMGILLFVVRTSRFEGASAYVSGLPFAFLAESFPPRMLFTLAHEIGHLVAHHEGDQDFAVVDSQTEKRASAKRDSPEFYAHAFASCLLMPKAGIGITLNKIRQMQQAPEAGLGDLELLLLSRIYGVSFYAAARRCEDLGLLPSGGAASLNETLLKEYGSAEKRAEAANLPRRAKLVFPPIPSALLKAASRRVRSGEMSIGKASSILGLSIADFLTVNAPRTN